MTAAFQRARNVYTLPVAHFDVRLAIATHLSGLTMQRHQYTCDDWTYGRELKCGSCGVLTEREFLTVDDRAFLDGRICPCCVADLDREEDELANADEPHCAGGCRVCLGA